jgi:hypothetical protein
MFAGFVSLGNTLRVLVQTKANGTTGSPAQADAMPKFRPYGASGNLAAANGTATQLEGAAITGATNATPIVVTSNGHGLTNGQRVTISGVVGNTGANGTFTVANVTTNTYELVSSVGNAPYVSGGAWVTTGLYAIDVVAKDGFGFEQGKTYSVCVTFAVAAVVYSVIFTFTVT